VVRCCLVRRHTGEDARNWVDGALEPVAC
jgi:hypothetical protein